MPLGGAIVGGACGFVGGMLLRPALRTAERHSNMAWGGLGLLTDTALALGLGVAGARYGYDTQNAKEWVAKWFPKRK